MGYILFSSDNKLSITAYPSWNGTIEYSYDNTEWYKWNGNNIVNNKIYMRGINNTSINAQLGNADVYPWFVLGKNIKCQGNLENLLDYKFVNSHIHPYMAPYCFMNLFATCNLVEMPTLLPTQFTHKCYWKMFASCKQLTISSNFPSITIAKEAILQQHMFQNSAVKTICINNKLYDINVLKLL